MSRSQSQNRRRRPERRLYRVGSGGARITWADGTVVDYAPHAIVMGVERPVKIEGRLYRLGPDGYLAYEAPAMGPDR